MDNASEKIPASPSNVPILAKSVQQGNVYPVIRTAMGMDFKHEGTATTTIPTSIQERLGSVSTIAEKDIPVAPKRVSGQRNANSKRIHASILTERAPVKPPDVSWIRATRVGQIVMVGVITDARSDSEQTVIVQRARIVVAPMRNVRALDVYAHQTATELNVETIMAADQPVMGPAQRPMNSVSMASASAIQIVQEHRAAIQMVVVVSVQDHVRNMKPAVTPCPANAVHPNTTGEICSEFASHRAVFCSQILVYAIQEPDVASSVVNRV